MHKQSQIGWDNLLRGKFSKKWGIFQRRYEKRQAYRKAARDNPYDKPIGAKKRKKDRFQTFFADIMTAAKEELWKERNKHRHKPDDKKQSAAEAKADMTISNMYLEYNKVLPNDVHLIFDVPEYERLNQPLKKKQAWINVWKQSIKASVKAAAKILPGQANMLRYYTTESNETPTTKINRERVQQHQKEVKQRERRRKNTTVNQFFRSEGKVRSTNRVTFVTKTVRRIQQSITTAFTKLVTPRASFDDRSDDAPT